MKIAVENLGTREVHAFLLDNTTDALKKGTVPTTIEPGKKSEPIEVADNCSLQICEFES